MTERISGDARDRLSATPPARHAPGDGASWLGPDDSAAAEHRPPRRRRVAEHSRIAINLTSLIDVTFLLLVYFILATQFESGEEVFAVDLPPQLQSDRARDPFALDEDPLKIEVASFGPAQSGCRITVDGASEQPATFDELVAFLRRVRIGGGNVGGLFEPDHPVVIQPSRATRWEHAIEAFNAALRARYTNINFAKPE